MRIQHTISFGFWPIEYETAVKMNLEFQTYTVLCLARLNPTSKRVWSTFEHENDSVRKQVKGVQMKLQVRRVQMKVRGVQNERPNERESVQMKQKGKRSKEKAATKGVGLGLYGWDGKSQQRFACV